MIKKSVVVLFVLGLFASCGLRPATTPQKPHVLVSLPPYAYIVKKIAADLVTVDTLIPPEANPHFYEPSPEQVQRHQSAALWVYVGENMDRKLMAFLQQVGSSTRTVNLSEGVDLLTDPGHVGCHHHDHSKDLHIWMSPKLLRTQAQMIGTALMELLPQESLFIEKNLEALLNELDQLDLTLISLLGDKQGATLMVSHPAFAYFCKEYGLEQLSVEIAGKEPRPQDISRLLQLAKERQIHTLIIEPQHSNKGAEAVAHLLEIPTTQIDPYKEDFTSTFLELAQVVAP